MHSEQVRHRRLVALLVLAGALVLIAAAVAPWYAWTVTFGGVTVTREFYPGLPSTNGTVQCSSSVPRGVHTSCGPSTSYDGASLSHFGILTAAVFVLTLLGAAVGILAAFLGWLWRKNPRRWMLSVVVVAIALIASLVACGGYAGESPSAFASDLHGTVPGPWSAFSGSTANNTVGTSQSWGPSVGWYLSVAASGLLFLGLCLMFLTRRPPQASGTAPSNRSDHTGDSQPARVRIPVSKRKPEGGPPSNPRPPS